MTAFVARTVAPMGLCCWGSPMEAKFIDPPWGWYSEDASMAVLCGDGGRDPIKKHVLSLGPCKACRALLPSDTKWEWGRCTTPSKEHAHFIIRAVNSHNELVETLESLDARLRECGALHTAEAYNRSYQSMVADVLKKARG